jgi:hypothetical protein
MAFHRLPQPEVASDFPLRHCLVLIAGYFDEQIISG